MSGSSTLDPDNFSGAGTASAAGYSANRSHGTGALGPSDLSDTGSDTVGGPGMLDDERIGLDSGTNEDAVAGRMTDTAGADLGDADIDSDSDSGGTGENVSVGRDPGMGAGHDIGFDRVVDAADAGLGAGLDQAEEARLGMTDDELRAAMADEPTDADLQDAGDAGGDPPGTGQMSDDDALLDQQAAQDGVEAGYGDGTETRSPR